MTNEGKIHEHTCNVFLADIMNSMRKNWKVRPEPPGVFDNLQRPDVLIEEKGVLNVIIENEFEPKNPERDALKRIGQTYRINGQKVNNVIALQTPKNILEVSSEDLVETIRQSSNFRYAVYTPERFPREGWLQGKLSDVARVAQNIAISEKHVKESVTMMKNSIEYVSQCIHESGHDTKHNIAKLLFQENDPQTWKMAGLILSNALVFHNHISGEHKIQPIEKLRIIGSVSVKSLILEWEKILQINYFAIFDIAKKILSEMDEMTANTIIERLVSTTSQINASGLARSTDMYGALIQETITDRKKLASFYTLPESAMLMASLVIPPASDKIWNSVNSVKKITIADFTCGTGTLLSTAYRKIIENYEINYGNMRSIHAHMMRENIIGFDILPSAVHLTVSSLASIFPKKLFDETRIGLMIYGMMADSYHLGSLDLISDQITMDKKGEFVRGKTSESYTNPQLPHSSVDYILMNPPFTSNTRHSNRDGLTMFSLLGINESQQREMSKREKAMFKQTCADGNAGYATHFIAIADKKLKPEGVFGMILPSTISAGSSWAKVREVLMLHYGHILVISLASTQNKITSFSFDTNMNEVILIAKKLPEAILKENDMMIAKLNESKIMLDKYTKEMSSNKIKSSKLVKLTKKVKRTKNEISTYQQKINDVFESRTGFFVTLNSRPRTTLLASEIGRVINKISNVSSYDRADGGTSIMIGKERVGSILQCPLNKPWSFVGVQDAMLIQWGFMLEKGILRLNNLETFEIPITYLGDRLGLNTRDIGVLSDSINRNDSNTRAPFFFVPLQTGITPAYYVLTKNDSAIHDTMQVKADMSAEPRVNFSEEHKMRVLKTISKIHINMFIGYASQKLSVLYTEQESFGGTSIPNVIIDKKFEKAFTVWCNSTLGIFCYWLGCGKQQLGRGIHSRTAIQNMLMLDFWKLSKNQIKEFDILFDDMSNVKLLPIMQLYKDKERMGIDDRINKILGTNMPLDDLRKRLCLEPSVCSGDPNSDLFGV